MELKFAGFIPGDMQAYWLLEEPRMDSRIVSLGWDYERQQQLLRMAGSQITTEMSVSARRVTQEIARCWWDSSSGTHAHFEGTSGIVGLYVRKRQRRNCHDGLKLH